MYCSIALGRFTPSKWHLNSIHSLFCILLACIVVFNVYYVVLANLDHNIKETHSFIWRTLWSPKDSSTPLVFFFNHHLEIFVLSKRL
jgi:hypothetical protein